MPVETDLISAGDPGLFTLVTLLRFRGISVNAEQVRQRCGTSTVGIQEMVRCAKYLGLRTRAQVTKWDRLSGIPLPGIAAQRDGGFLILAKVSEDTALIQYPVSPGLETITRAQFEAMWDGRLVLMTRGSALSGFARHLVRPFTEMGEAVRRLAQRIGFFLTRRSSRAAESTIDPATEISGPDPTITAASGLARLVLLLRAPPL